MIDLKELERLLNEDIDLDGEKLTANGTQVYFSDDFKFAHAFAKNNDFWLASVRARLIAAAINAMPELIAENRALREKVRELEGRLAEFTKENSSHKRVIQMLEYRVLELKGKPIPMEPRQFIPSSNRSNAKEAL